MTKKKLLATTAGQTLDMLEEDKESAEDAVDITDMFETGGRSLVMARRPRTTKVIEAL